MRILLLAQFFPPDIGGEERHVLNLANTLAARGHSVSVGTQLLPGVPDEEVLDSGVRVHRFATSAMRLPALYSDSRRPHHPPFPDPMAVRALRRIVAAERPEVVHAHNWIVHSVLPLRRARARFGLVLTLHDYSHVCATKRLQREGRLCPGPGLTRCPPCAVRHYGPLVGPVTVAAAAGMRVWKDKRVDRIVCVSRAVAARNGLTGDPRVAVIPNFIPDVLAQGGSPGLPGEEARPGRDPDLPAGDFLLFAGDLSADKGVPQLLAAYRGLGASRPDLLLLGRPHATTPRELPDGARIGVEWAHPRALGAFGACLAAVLPSQWPDPCPTTVLEAMAAGRAVITTAGGGMVDMVVDGRSGVLVPVGDVPALGRAMAGVIADPDLRAHLGAGAREAVQAFSASVVAARLEDVYAAVGAGGGA